MLPTRSHREGAALSDVIAYEASREALAPLTLQQGRFVQAQAAVETEVALPVDFSTQGVWARVTLTEGGWLEVSSRRQRIDGSALVFFPMSNKALRFTVERAQGVVLEPVASVDSAGGGFDVKSEAPVTTPLVVGAVRIDDVVTLPDDTFARLARVELRASAAGQVLLGRCGEGGHTPTVIDASFEVTPGAPVVTTQWLAAGALCVQSNVAAELTVAVEGRVRRFAETSLRAVRPVTVLDTASGVGGWLGAPAPAQPLEVSLDGLTGLGDATHVLFRVASDGPVSLGACGATATARAAGSLVLLPVTTKLCASVARQAQLAVTLVATVGARSEAVGQCGARPPTPDCTATTLLGKLRCIPGVAADPLSSPRTPPGSTQYLLTITQPVDHFRPEGATFGQRAILTVRNEAGPVVLHTTGYELFSYFSDLSRHFSTNELELEHRFYNASTPQPLDYSTLTIMQSAWDSHRVVEALSPLFPAAWVNTGHSKGGMTALYHRRFFPCDVAATAPYVTPLSLDRQDARYGPWLAQLGGAAHARCHQAMETLEQGVIARRAEFAPRLQGTYTRVGSPENALWTMTGATLWNIFQSGTQNDPERGCPAWEPLLGHPDFDLYVGQYATYAESYADESLQQTPLDGYSYQTQNELGSPGMSRAHLEQFGPIPLLLDQEQLSFGSDVPVPVFEPRAMRDVQSWLKRHGEHFFFLYGGFDPWTGGKVDVEDVRDALQFVVPGADHGVSIDDLAEPQREEAYSRIEGWLGARRLPKRAGAARGEDLPAYRDFMHLHRL